MAAANTKTNAKDDPGSLWEAYAVKRAAAEKAAKDAERQEKQAARSKVKAAMLATEAEQAKEAAQQAT